jgi:hypothetical protein
VPEQFIADRPIAWNRVCFPYNTNERHCTVKFNTNERHDTGKSSELSHTIGHTQAKIIDRFPVAESLLDSTDTPVIGRIIVVFHKVPDKELALALSAEQEPETETMKYAPRKRMHSVKDKCCLVRQWW